jgi:predicted RNA methylase
MKGTLPKRVELREARHVSDRAQEIARINEKQAHLLEGTLFFLRNDETITPQEFAIISRLVGLFEYPQQSPEAVAHELDVSTEQVDRSLQNVLGKIRGHHSSVMRRLKEVESTISAVQDVAS